MERSRYMLFAGDDYDNGGGWDNFICQGDDPLELKMSLLDTEDDHKDAWYHLVDTLTMKIVEAGREVHSTMLDRPEWEGE